MATSIAGAGDFMSQQFAPIYSMIGSQQSAGGSGLGGIQPQAMSGNDLTQMQRSLTNYLGLTGAQLGGLGQNVIGGGLGVTQQGLQTLQSPIDYYQAILSGQPGATSAALAPTASNLASLYSGATNQASQGLPAGGYRAATLAGLPFAQASQLGNALLALQPQAAQGLAGLGGEQAQIGQGLGQLGSTLTGQGISSAADAVNAVLNKMNLNLKEGSPFQDIMQAFGTFGGALGGIGGLLKGLNSGGTTPGSTSGGVQV